MATRTKHDGNTSRAGFQPCGPFTLNVIDEHKGSVPADGSTRYRPFVLRQHRRNDERERVSLIVRSLRGMGRRLVRLADRLETA